MATVDAMSALLQALCSGDLSASAAAAAAPPKQKKTLLDLAAEWSGPHFMQAHLVRKIQKRLDADPTLDVNARDAGGETALHHLVNKRLNVAARYLIEKGADPLTPDAQGKTVLLMAALGATDAAGVGTALFLGWAIDAARSRSPECARMVDYLLNKHSIHESHAATAAAAVGVGAGEVMSLLEIAITRDAPSDGLVRILLDHGALPDGPEATARWRPLHHAVNACNAGAASMLIERGADVDTRAESGGTTPLLMAVIKEDMDMISLLLRHGADPSARTSATAMPNGNPAWANKDACDLAYMDGNRALAETLRTWSLHRVTVATAAS